MRSRTSRTLPTVTTSRRGLLAATAAILAGCATNPTPIAGTSSAPVPPASGTPAATSSASASPGTTSAASVTPRPSPTPTPTPTPSSALPARSEIVARFGSRVPKQWGMEVTGLVLRSASPQVCLTYDACGGPYGSKVDQELLDLLIRENIPATLFLNQRWIEVNRPTFDQIASSPTLFDIGNHGTRHMPLSVTGKMAYNEPATQNAGEVYDEVAGNHHYLTTLLGKPPRFFRTGTAHYDEVAIEIVRAMGEIPIGFDINGDAGTTFTTAQVIQETGRAKKGSIVIAHMNQPSRQTYEGMAVILPRLRDKGTAFARLSDVTLT